MIDDERLLTFLLHCQSVVREMQANGTYLWDDLTNEDDVVE